MVMSPMPSGYAVFGDVQFLPGYCVLLSRDPTARALADLPRRARVQFLADADLLATAVEQACREADPAFRRVNLEITWSYRGPHGLLEVGPPGVTKATALVTACQELDADPHDAVAFGDMPNDLAMLQLGNHGHSARVASGVGGARTRDRGIMSPLL